MNTDAGLAGNNQAGHNAKRKLRGDEPPPIDFLVEQRVEQSHDAVEQSRPKNRRNNSTQQDRATRKHGQHGAVQKTDEQTGNQVNAAGEKKTVEMKSLQRGGTEKRRLSVESGREQVDRIPDTALLDDAVKAGEYRHGDAAGQTTLDTR